MLISFMFENWKSYGEKTCLQPQAGSQGTGCRSGYAWCFSVPADGLYESRRGDCHSDKDHIEGYRAALEDAGCREGECFEGDSHLRDQRLEQVESIE